MSNKGKCRAWTLDVAKSRCEVVGACWLWQQGTNNQGHPQACIHGKSSLVRRWVLEQMLGRPIKSGFHASASCGDTLCTSPHHLFERSNGAMVKQSYADGRRGGAHETAKRRAAALKAGFAVISMADAMELRARIFELPRQEMLAEIKKFAEERGISKKWAGLIARGRRGWKVDASNASSIFTVGAAA